MFSEISEAVNDFRNGKFLIVVDDEDRENEGDLIIASRFATPEVINFMSKEARGLICISLDEDRCSELGIDKMVQKNTSPHETPFTVSVDLIGKGCTTGISAFDRSKTIQALINKDTKPENLAKPGHIFPLVPKKGGVLRRAGHTEAASDLGILAGYEPSGVLVEIMSESGHMAKTNELIEFGKKHNIKLISIKSLIKYRMRTESTIQLGPVVDLPTRFGFFRVHAFKENQTPNVHLAIVKGTWEEDDMILVRAHSSCLTGDILHSLRCDCGEQLEQSMKIIQEAGKGVLLYMNQEGRGIGLINKLKAYELQEKGLDTVEANEELGFKPDQRDYGVGAQILNYLGVKKINLISNNPKKRVGLKGYGLEILDTTPIIIPPNEFNMKYLKTKKNKFGHNI